MTELMVLPQYHNIKYMDNKKIEEMRTNMKSAYDDFDTFMPKTDNILSLKSRMKPDSLKLLPNTIVSKKIIIRS